MVTPLHPVGHAMAIGGLGVLGTEFEAPKKVFQKAKQSAANLAAKMKKPPASSAKGAKAPIEEPSSKSMSETNQEDDEVIVINT
jgi:hypothetical protein